MKHICFVDIYRKHRQAIKVGAILFKIPKKSIKEYQIKKPEKSIKEYQIKTPLFHVTEALTYRLCCPYIGYICTFASYIYRTLFN